MSWQVKKEEKYSIYSPLSLNEKDLISSMGSLILSQNIIIDFRDASFSNALVVLLTKVNKQQQNRNQSFVVLVPSKEIMHLYEDQFVTVPSISEAIDYIFMEELQRSLGQ